MGLILNYYMKSASQGIGAYSLQSSSAKPACVREGNAKGIIV